MNYRWPILCRNGSQNTIFLLYSFSHWNVFININFLMLVMTNCEKWKTCFHVYGRRHQKTHDTFCIPTVRYTKTHLPLASTHSRSVQHVTKILLPHCFLLYNENSEAGESGIFQLATDNAAGLRRNPIGVDDLVMNTRFGVHRAVTTNITTFQNKTPWSMLTSYKPRRKRLLSSVWCKN